MTHLPCGLGPSTQVLTHPSKQHKPKLGQSECKSYFEDVLNLDDQSLHCLPVSAWPGDQQLEAAPAHWLAVRGLTAGQLPSDTTAPIIGQNILDWSYPKKHKSCCRYLIDILLPCPNLGSTNPRVSTVLIVGGATGWAVGAGGGRTSALLWWLLSGIRSA